MAPAPTTKQEGLDLLKARAASMRESISQLELALKNYPLVQQSVLAYRAHVAEQRDFLKWIAAFASAGLFLVTNAVRGGPQPVSATSVQGLIIAELAFLLCVLAAGMYWWRVDLPMGRYLEFLQHRVSVDMFSLSGVILAYRDMEVAISAGDITKAIEAYDRSNSISAEATARGPIERPKFNDTQSMSLFWKALCVGGFGVGIMALVLDQIVKMTP